MYLTMNDGNPGGTAISGDGILRSPSDPGNSTIRLLVCGFGFKSKLG